MVDGNSFRCLAGRGARDGRPPGGGLTDDGRWHSHYESANPSLALSPGECKQAPDTGRRWSPGKIGGVTSPVEVLRVAYTPLLELADALEETAGWTSTALPGWTTRDLLFHLATDAQRGLVALGTPAPGAPDTDAVSYWRSWQPGGLDADAGRRGTRMMASVWSSVRGPAELFATTARAALQLASAADPDAVVLTQGHALTVETLVRTLTVEAAVQHLDLHPVLPASPAPAVLAEVRRVLDGLLGAPAPAGWSDVDYARAGTGRATLTAAERAQLGGRADRFPLFG